MSDAPAPSMGELLAHARFEVLPLAGVEREVAYLPKGTTVTVTCSPSLGPEHTLRVAERLAGQGYRAVPHLSARLVASRGHLQELLGRAEDAHLGDVFVIAGDVAEPVGPYASAVDLLEAMAGVDHRPRDVGVGGYPEGHPLIDDQALFEALADKQHHATYLVTQICFHPAVVFDWVAGIRGRGIHLPVYIGLPGVVRRRKLVEISLRVGVGDSVRYLTKHGNMVARLVRRGGYRPDAFVARAAPLVHDREQGLRGFHIFTFNQIRSTEEWRRQILSAYGQGGRLVAEGGEDEHGTAS